jgi:hypothetical protein
LIGDEPPDLQPVEPLQAVWVVPLLVQLLEVWPEALGRVQVHLLAEWEVS